MSDTPLTTETITHALCNFLQENILAADITVTADTHLESIGVDSFSLMEIILFIERRFDLVIAPESLTQENIASVNALSHCCNQLLTQAKT
jgi:acyl carrier protein